MSVDAADATRLHTNLPFGEIRLRPHPYEFRLYCDV